MEGSRLEGLGVAVADLERLEADRAQPQRVVEHPEGLGRDEGGLSAPERLEDVHAELERAEQVPGSSVPDRHAVLQDEVAEEALQRKAVVRQYPDQRDPE